MKPLTPTGSALLGSLTDLLRRHREQAIDVLVHIATVDTQRSYLAEGYGTMLEFCRRSLGMSEDEAEVRLAVARLCRRLPALLDALRRRVVTVPNLYAVRAVLDANNLDAVLRASKEATERLGERITAGHEAGTFEGEEEASALAIADEEGKGLVAVAMLAAARAHDPRTAPS